jgi:hypothetical protein
MNRERYSSSRNVLWAGAIVLLVLIAANLACDKAGEILTPAEATARAADATARAKEANVASTATPKPTIEGQTAEPEAPPEGPQIGDTVYLGGTSFLIRLLDKPGGTRMIAGQEKGVEVQIVNITEYENERWYLVDAPTGEGWVPEENITTEKP